MSRISTYAFLTSAIALALPIPMAFAQSKDITIVLQTQPDQVDPCQSSKSHVGRVIKQNVVETITELKDGEAAPRLATEWSQVDEKTWRFKLREGVSFHDGTPFNAEALKYSMERTLDESLACEIRTKYFSGAEFTIKPIGDYEVEISSNIAQPILPKLMSTMVAMSTASPKGEHTRNPIGTGPYRFVEWAPDQQIVLERYGEYWGEAPVVEKATYIWRSDSSVRAAMVKLGEADIAPTIGVQDATDPSMDFSYLNSESTRYRIDVAIPPLNDVRVRKALNLALDRQAMVGTVLSADTQIATQLVPPGTTGYNPDIKPYSYNPDEARKLLAEAKADGVPVDTEIVVYSRYNLYPNVDEAMQVNASMWRDVGFNIKVQFAEAAEWYDLFLKPHAENRGPNLNEDMHDNNNGDAVFTVFNKYHSQGAQSTIEVPEIDDLIDRAAQEVGPERQQLYAEMFRAVHDDVVADVPLFHMVGFTRVNPRLEFTPTIATNSELQLSQVSFK